MQRRKWSLLSAVAALVLLPAFGTPSLADNSVINGTEVVRNQAIVSLSNDAPIGEEVETLSALQVELIKDLSLGTARTYLVSLDPFQSAALQLMRLSSSEFVEYAEPNFVVTSVSTSNDPGYTNGDLWGMQGISSGNQYGSNASAAWAAGYTGNPYVYVAILDSGVDFNHPDLSANKWVNSGEIASDGIDNDGNGYVDDVNGYDFVRNDATVFDIDEHYHGTHVAGTVAAVGGNGTGVAGVAWNVKLISAKMINASGEASISTAIAAVNYVVNLRTKKGLDIIAMNASWGGPGYSRALEEAIARGGDAGIVFVAAAGNGEEGEGRDLANSDSYPAELDCTTEARDWDCIVSVAAIDETGDIAVFSDYNTNSIDIGAPGVDVISTYTIPGVSPTRGYGYLSGTSMAAPHVTGALALCVSSYRGISAELAIEKLFATAVPTASLNQKVATNGRLDAGALVNSCVGDTTSFAGNHSEVYASAIYTDQIRLDWADTVAGDFEQEVQIAVGPAGCTGTFSHFAFIGPGITSYPINDLDEAQFYCFRIRSNVQSGANFTYSSYMRSNVSITWTSNLPFLYGKVVLDDGVTPVANAPVKWVASGQFQNSSTSGVVVKTDASGNYVTQVSNGTPGILSVDLPITAKAGAMTTPIIPWGISASGALTINADRELDFKLPPQHLITFKVVDDGTPVAGAQVSWDDLAKYCIAGSYSPFVGATSPTCKSWPFGTSSSKIRTNSQGEVTLAFPAANLLAPNSRTYTMSARHPSISGKVGSLVLNPSADQTVEIELADVVTLSGKVLLSDGTTPVGSADVYWLPKGVYADSNHAESVKVTTNAQGEYSMPVSAGIQGRLYVATTISSRSTPITTPRIPWGLNAGGLLTVNSNATRDITLPKQQLVTFSVTEYDSPDLVVGAKVQYSDLAQYCNNGSYVAFSGATGSTCMFWPTGTSSSNILTNSQGEATIALLDNQYFSSNRNRSYSVTHPILKSRVTSVTVNVSADSVIPVSMPAPVTVSGKVFMADGVTPIAGAPVKWVADSQYSSMGFPGVNTVTDANGNYSLQISLGTPGELAVETPANASAGAIGNPALPFGLYAGGGLTLTQNAIVNLTMPEQHFLTITAREMSASGLGDPINNAQVKYEGLAQNCIKGRYTAFAGATNSNCKFWPAGFSHSSPKTNSAGSAVIPILANKYFSATTYTFSVVHPMDPARIKSTTLSITGNTAVSLEMPGTPSQPEQPNAVAGDGTVTLTWTEPWNGGAFIDFYQVWVSLSAEGPFELVSSGDCAGNIAPQRRSCTVTGLTPGVTYYFAIIAKNVVGYSDLSISVASTPTATIQNLSLTPTPTISGTATVDQTLSAAAGTWDNGVTLSYQWRRDGVAIPNANSANYSLVMADIGSKISVSVTGTKIGFNSVTKTSSETSIVSAANLTLTPTPTISGSTVVGQTLTASAGSWDAGVTLSYQWLRSGQPIANADEATYLLVTADTGSNISVRVTGSKSGFNSTSKTSVATNAIAEPEPVVVSLGTISNQPAPVIDGEPIVGQTITSTIGTWDDGVSLVYQWLRNGVAISGANGETYLISDADVASILSLQVIATKSGFESVTKASEDIGPVGSVSASLVVPPSMTLTPTPTISGSATVGSTLTATVGTWDQGVIFSYQWHKDSVAVFGATSLTYQVTQADIGGRLKIVVTGTKTGLASFQVESAETQVVLAQSTSSGGGGGGGGGAAPVAIPAITKPLPAGKAVAVVNADGLVIDAELNRSSDGKSVGLTGFGWKLSLSSAALVSDPDGTISVAPGTPLAISASGYQPGTTVYFYLVPKSSLQIASFSTQSVISLGTSQAAIDGSFSFEAKPQAPAGDYLLQISGTTQLGIKTSVAFTTKLITAISKPLAITKLSGNKARFSASDVIGKGKVSFRLNGKEVAWVNARNAKDKKLKLVNGQPTLTKTVTLRKGKNTLEIWVKGKRQTRVTITVK